MPYKKFLLSLIILTTTLLPQDRDTSLVAHYKLSRDNFNAEKNYFTDLSGNGNHATPSDTFQFVEDHLGNPDGAMQFDGIKDYLNCVNPEAFNPGNNNWTFLAWLKMKDVQSRDWLKCNLFSLYQDWPNHFAYQLFNWDYHSHSLYVDGYNVFYDLQKQIGFEPEIYHLIAVNIDRTNNNFNVFKNGYLIYQTDISNWPDINFENLSDGFRIGYPYGANLFFYEGLIDEIKIIKNNINTDLLLKLFNNHHPHLLYDGFERGDIEDGVSWYSRQSYPSDATGETIDQCAIDPYKGDYCAKSTIPPHPTARKGRAQIIFRAGIGADFKSDQEIWISYWWKADKNFKWTPKEYWNISSQFHGLYNVATSIRYYDDTLYLHLETTKRINSDKSKIYSGEKQKYGYKPQKGKWYNFVEHFKPSYTDTGYYEVWIDGDKTQLISTDTSYFDDYGNPFVIKNNRAIWRSLHDKNDFVYIQPGYYRGDSVEVENSMYFDEFKIGLTAESIGFDPDNLNNFNPKLSISSDIINFGIVKQNSEKIYNLKITNSGNYNLQILSCNLNKSKKYKIINYPESVSPEAEQKIEISFKPESLIEYTDTLMLISNDPESDTLLIPLKGKGGLPELKINVPSRN